MVKEVKLTYLHKVNLRIIASSSIWFKAERVLTWRPEQTWMSYSVNTQPVVDAKLTLNRWPLAVTFGVALIHFLRAAAGACVRVRAGALSTHAHKRSFSRIRMCGGVTSMRRAQFWTITGVDVLFAIVRYTLVSVFVVTALYRTNQFTNTFGCTI